MNKEIREKYAWHFKDHKATKVLDQEDFLILDWRKENGSSAYFVRYIVDIKRGSLIIQGDLGDCIATWYNRVAPEDMRYYINDVGYFISKFQCTTDKYNYDREDALADFEDSVKEYYSEVDEELIENAKEAIENYWDDRNGHLDSSIIDAFHEIDQDWWDGGLTHLGERIDGRVYLWVIGFQMACDQLGIGG